MRLTGIVKIGGALGNDPRPLLVPASGQRPVNRGFRLSTKAAMPSF